MNQAKTSIMQLMHNYRDVENPVVPILGVLFLALAFGGSAWGQEIHARLEGQLIYSFRIPLLLAVLCAAFYLLRYNTRKRFGNVEKSGYTPGFKRIVWVINTLAVAVVFITITYALPGQIILIPSALYFAAVYLFDLRRWYYLIPALFFFISAMWALGRNPGENVGMFGFDGNLMAFYTALGICFIGIGLLDYFYLKRAFAKMRIDVAENL